MSSASGTNWWQSANELLREARSNQPVYTSAQAVVHNTPCTLLYYDITLYTSNTDRNLIITLGTFPNCAQINKTLHTLVSKNSNDLYTGRLWVWCAVHYVNIAASHFVTIYTGRSTSHTLSHLHRRGQAHSTHSNPSKATQTSVGMTNHHPLSPPPLPLPLSLSPSTHIIIKLHVLWWNYNEQTIMMLPNWGYKQQRAQLIFGSWQKLFCYIKNIFVSITHESREGNTHWKSQRQNQ